MQNWSKSKQVLVLAAAVATLGGTLKTAYAANTDGVWNSIMATANWSDTTKWVSGNVADGTGYTADFGQVNGTTDITVTLDSSRFFFFIYLGYTYIYTAAGWTLSSASNTLTLAVSGGSPTITVNQLGTNKTATISALLGGSQGFTKAGVGTLILAPAAAESYTGDTVINGGTLQLNYTSTVATNLISSTSALSVNGGILSLNVAASVTGSQTFNGTTLNQGETSITVTRGLNAIPVIHLGTVTRNIGSILIVPANVTNTSIYSAATSTFAGGYVTDVGMTNILALDATGKYVTAAYATNTWASGNNTLITTSATLADGATTQSLGYRNTSSNTLTLSGTATITSGGILMSSAASTAANVITGGKLKGAAGQDLVVIQADATAGSSLTINSEIADNTTATALTKGGAGLLILGGTNTFSGDTFINNGTVRLTNSQALQNSSLNLGSSQLGILDFGALTSATLGGLKGSRNLALTNGSAAAVALTVGNNNLDSTYTGALSGSGNLIKSGSGKLIFSGNNSYTGITTITNGTLAINGSIASSSGVNIASGSMLSGSGSVSVISGAGKVSPGNSPGILTATQVDPSAGTKFAFEMTATGSPNYASATASTNDVLRLTSATPFISSLTNANEVDVYLGVTTFSNGDTFKGAWYTDNSASFTSSITSANFIYYVKGDGNGSVSFNGNNYYALSSLMPTASVVVSTVNETGTQFSGIDGYATQFVVTIPEPATVSLVGGLAFLGLMARRRRPAAAK